MNEKSARYLLLALIAMMAYVNMLCNYEYKRLQKMEQILNYDLHSFLARTNYCLRLAEIIQLEFTTRPGRRSI